MTDRPGTEWGIRYKKPFADVVRELGMVVGTLQVRAEAVGPSQALAEVSALLADQKPGEVEALLAAALWQQAGLEGYPDQSPG